ncbi:cache domain-containing protein [Candidatus Roizmanbacteria bacterium]|nr:cache domain-containing protein [Candidatus Roizmanbacteria bacterium]
MLLTQFLLVNANFVLCLGTALVLFSIFWLYFDAWLIKKGLLESLTFFGFLLLSVSYVAQSAVIDQALLDQSILGGQILETIRFFTRTAGYLVLIISQISLPLQPLPEYRKRATGIMIFSVGIFFFPFLAALTGLLYLRRATKGLENHLKPISSAFFILALSELIALSTFFKGSDNVLLASLTSAFGVLWIVQRLVLVLAIVIFGKWAWSYLLKRFSSQLFIIFTSSILLIFLVTTIFFTFATLNNVKNDLLSTLKTDVGVLGYTIESKKTEVTSDAETLAQNSELISQVVAENRKILADITVPVLVTKKASELIVISKTGEIILRAEDSESRGGSLSNDPLVKVALAGKKISSVVTREGVIAPIVSVQAAVPILEANKVAGVILMGSDIDNAYVDGVKKATGLDTSVYADDVRSATTLVSQDGKNRYIGIKESSEAVKKTVLEKSQTYVGSTNILNIPYFSAFAPLINSENNPVGMLYVGRPEVSILQTASRSIELTFITTIILLILSIIPSYFISKYIEKQIR